MTVKLVSNEKIAETSSKGNQEKWRDDGRWYKLDQFGYEALAESIVSRLLEESSIERDTPFSFVRYRMERLQVHGRERTGCSSPDFLQPGCNIITLGRLFQQYLGRSVTTTLNGLPSDKKRMAYLAETTAEITGLSLFPQYLTLLFEIDALVLNDDRHLNNIAVLSTPRGFNYCPIFDQGAGLLSNIVDAPLHIEPAALISQVRACPLHTTFNRQIRTMQSLYGPQLRIPDFTRAQLMEKLKALLPYYAQRDQFLIAERVCKTILLRQKAK